MFVCLFSEFFVFYRECINVFIECCFFFFLLVFVLCVLSSLFSIRFSFVVGVFCALLCENVFLSVIIIIIIIIILFIYFDLELSCLFK